MKIDEPPVIQKIINNYSVDLLSHDIDLKNFFSKAKESVLKDCRKWPEKDTKNLSHYDINVYDAEYFKQNMQKNYDDCVRYKENLFN